MARDYTSAAFEDGNGDIVNVQELECQHAGKEQCIVRLQCLDSGLPDSFHGLKGGQAIAYYFEPEEALKLGLEIVRAAKSARRRNALAGDQEANAIQFFYWSDAPEWMREECDQGGDEDWIAVYPHDHREAPEPGDRDVWCPYFRDCCSIDSVQLSDGRMALVGTHA